MCFKNLKCFTCFITLWSIYIPEFLHKSIWSLNRPRDCTLKQTKETTYKQKITLTNSFICIRRCITSMLVTTHWFLHLYLIFRSSQQCKEAVKPNPLLGFQVACFSWLSDPHNSLLLLGLQALPLEYRLTQTCYKDQLCLYIKSWLSDFFTPSIKRNSS